MQISANTLGGRIGVNGYTIKRWYEFYEDLDEDEIEILTTKYNMPRLPAYKLVQHGDRLDKVWEETDVPVLMAFKKWSPPTRSGIFKQFSKKG